MLSFKPKTTKKFKVSKKNSTTLDGKHREFINDFNKDEQDRIPNLKFERAQLREKLASKDVSQELTIEQIMECIDRIEEINENIKFLKQKK